MNDRHSTADKALSALEQARRLRPDERALAGLLDALASADIADPRLLVRFHDALLFLRAYPPSPRLLNRAESLLRSVPKLMAALRKTEDFDPLLDLDVSGIAGSSIETDGYSYDCVRWLAARFRRSVTLDVDLIKAPDRVAALLQPFLPLLEEEASADANLSIEPWLRAAGAIDRDGGLHWLLQQIDGLPLPPRMRASLYESLGLFVRWDIGNAPASRTRMRRPARSPFFHDAPLLGRRDVDLDREMASAPMPLARLPKKVGAALLDLAREAMATRYRELYGFTHGDPASVISADAGRGLEIVICGIVPARRLPIRGGFGTLLLKNGVPVGYADAYGIGARLDISLNIFYAYRDGESAWCFARLLRLYNQLFGSAVFSLDAYQIGKENEEAIHSGAFWFYRKLGFRSTDPAVEAMANREEKRMASDPSHRTTAQVLRRMARGNLIYEVPGHPRGVWDRFHIRNVGLAVERAMAKSGLRPDRFRADCSTRVSKILGLTRRPLEPAEHEAFERMAPLLAVLPPDRWSTAERAMLVDAIRAKASRHESAYLRLTAAFAALQQALLRLGREPKER